LFRFLSMYMHGVTDLYGPFYSTMPSPVRSVFHSVIVPSLRLFRSLFCLPCCTHSYEMLGGRISSMVRLPLL
jgi:hypothetical protein